MTKKGKTSKRSPRKEAAKPLKTYGTKAGPSSKPGASTSEATKADAKPSKPVKDDSKVKAVKEADAAPNSRAQKKGAEPGSEEQAASARPDESTKAKPSTNVPKTTVERSSTEGKQGKVVQPKPREESQAVLDASATTSKVEGQTIASPVATTANSGNAGVVESSGPVLNAAASSSSNPADALPRSEDKGKETSNKDKKHRREEGDKEERKAKRRRDKAAAKQAAETAKDSANASNEGDGSKKRAHQPESKDDEGARPEKKARRDSPPIALTVDTAEVPVVVHNDENQVSPSASVPVNEVTLPELEQAPVDEGTLPLIQLDILTGEDAQDHPAAAPSSTREPKPELIQALEKLALAHRATAEAVANQSQIIGQALRDLNEQSQQLIQALGREMFLPH